MCVAQHQASSNILETQAGSGEHRHGDHTRHGHKQGGAGGDVLTVRAMSGLSGDMMLTGLIRMVGMSGTEQQRVLDELIDALDLPVLRGCASLERRSTNSVAGWGCRVELPHEHAHRPLAEILRIIEASRLEPGARELAAKAFALLHALGAEFGSWPDMTVRERALVYGTRVFPGVPNGAIWALGAESRI